MVLTTKEASYIIVLGTVISVLPISSTTSLPCHISRYDENLEETSCYLKQQDLASTSTVYASGSSCKVIKACFIDSCGCFHEIQLWKSQSWQNHNVQSHRLCWQILSLTMEVSHSGWWLIGHVAHYVYQLYIILLLDHHSPRYRYTDIQWHAAPYSCWYRSYGLFWILLAGSYAKWLHWQHYGGLTGIWVVATCHGVTYLLIRPLVCSILIQAPLAEAVTYPSVSGVEYEGKMILKGSGKSWGIYS